MGVRGSWLFARADSEIFDFTRDLLTIEKNGFDAPVVAFDLGLVIKPRLDAVFAVEFSRASVVSEYREFVDENDVPIVQETGLTQVQLSGSLKTYLNSRGRVVSQYAWSPSVVTPYVGGGGGFLWYKFSQSGDFVDFVDLSVFADTFESNTWTLGAHVFGGTDVKLSRRLFLTMEARYRWADAGLERDSSALIPSTLPASRSPPVSSWSSDKVCAWEARAMATTWNSTKGRNVSPRRWTWILASTLALGLLSVSSVSAQVRQGEGGACPERRGHRFALVGRGSGAGDCTKKSSASLIEPWRIDPSSANQQRMASPIESSSA